MARIWNKHKQTNTPLKRKVIVGLSGGVDSAVAALFLKMQGFAVRAVFMLNWSESASGCHWEWDYESAKMAARHLDIPLELWNFEAVYRTEVYEPFIASLARGETPNPDVICNRHVKFGAFLEKARSEGADWVATGHYAQIDACARDVRTQVHATDVKLLSGVDATKDQSYFLATLGQDQLSSILFPLGGITKKEVRHIAHAHRLPNAGRKDSYGICFIGEQPMKEFLRTRVPYAKGPMVTVEGAQAGEHEGLPFYTIGQRNGIGIGGRGPFYAVEKRVAENTLIVAQGNDHPALFTNTAAVVEMHWIRGEPSLPLYGRVRHRHLQPLQDAVIQRQEGTYVILFSVPQRAVTPGQFLAVYQEEECLGGGVIASANPKSEALHKHQFQNPNT